MSTDHRTAELKAELAEIEFQIQNVGTYLGGEVGDSEFMKLLGTLVAMRERRDTIKAELDGKIAE